MRGLGPIYRAAKWLDDRWTLGAWDPQGVFITFDDLRDTHLERVCHELAHAALLGLAYGPDLTIRIAATVRAMPDQRDTRRGTYTRNRNEIETYSVVIEALRWLGVRPSRAEMVWRCARQAGVDKTEVRATWRSFAADPRREAAVQAVLGALAEHDAVSR